MKAKKKATKKGKLVLMCRCCDEIITEDMTDEAWTDGINLFCNAECLARWVGDELQNVNMNDTYGELLEEYGKNEGD
jgi:hypothetical protein